MITGSKDLDREILKKVDDKELLKVCSINKRFWYEVCDDSFLRRRLQKYHIQEYKIKNENWKQLFSRFVQYTYKLKEFDGDFENQYYFLSEYKDMNQLLVQVSKLGELSLVVYAIRKGADVHTEFDISLIWASEDGHLEVVKYLLNNGADIHATEALIRASAAGHLEVVKHLVERGMDFHIYNDQPLRLATLNCHLEVVKYLKSL